MRQHSNSINNARLVLLTKSQLKSMDQVNDEVARVMGMLSVHELHTFSGGSIDDPDQLVDGKLYVALRDDEDYSPRPEFTNKTYVLIELLLFLYCYLIVC